MAANPYYTDTRREALDTPNVGASLVQGYLGYRVPVATAIMQARIQAMRDANAQKAALQKELATLDDGTDKLYETAQKLLSSKLSAEGAMAQVLAAGINQGGAMSVAETNFETQTQTAAIQAKGAIDKEKQVGETELIKGGQVRGTGDTRSQVANAMRNASNAQAATPEDMQAIQATLEEELRRVVQNINDNHPHRGERQALYDEARATMLSNMQRDFPLSPAWVGAIADSIFKVEDNVPERPTPSYGGRLPPRRSDQVPIGLLNIGEGVTGQPGATIQQLADPMVNAQSLIQAVGGTTTTPTQPFLDELMAEIAARKAAMPEKRKALEDAIANVDMHGGLGDFYDPLGGPRVKASAPGAKVEQPKAQKPQRAPEDPMLRVQTGRLAFELMPRSEKSLEREAKREEKKAERKKRRANSYSTELGGT